MITAPPTPTIRPCDDDDLLARLKTVPQYSRSSVRLSVKEINVCSLISLARRVREYKYRQVERLVDLYDDASLQLFSPAIVDFGSTSPDSFITPPVVEEVGDKFVLIEGTTRAVYCRDNGMSTIRCVVAEGVAEPLPATPLPLSSVQIFGTHLDVTHRYDGFSYERFRPIEKVVHPISDFVS